MPTASDNTTPLWKTALAALALAVSCYVYLPGFRTALTSQDRVADYFQEWASGKNYFEGLPIYTPQILTAWHYLKYRPDETRTVFVHMNGHPPAAVLAALPLSLLPYSTAFSVWSLATLAGALLLGGLCLRMEFSPTRLVHWLLMLALVISNALLQHVVMGQFGVLLALLIVGVAWAERRRYDATAGLLLGTATALKLFPGLLCLYFVANRRLKTLTATLAVFAAWNAAAWATFGSRTFRDFATHALPEVMRYRDWWANYSITGAWFKLFDTAGKQSVALWQSPLTARCGSMLCVVAAAGLCMLIARRARHDDSARRTSLATMVIAAVLVSPVAWDHYFVLLAWPLARLAARLQGTATRAVLAAACAVLWINPLVLHIWATDPRTPASPAAVLGLISWPFYSLLTVFGLCAALAWREVRVGGQRAISENRSKEFNPSSVEIRPAGFA